MRKRQKRMMVLAIVTVFAATALFLPGLVGAGDMEPPGPPGSTMKTLDQIPPTWSQILRASERFKVLKVPCFSPPCPFPTPIWGVLDNETGLVWEQSPDTTTTRTWTSACTHCYQREVGRKGWRLPTVEELASLVDNDNSPALPTGHPFSNVQSSYYWSSTTHADGTSYAWGVGFGNGDVLYSGKSSYHYVWCVRGGHGHDAY